MTLQPIQGLGQLSALSNSKPAPNSGGSFEQIVQQFIQQAQQAEGQADAMVEQFALGQVDSVHSVMLAVAQAEMAVRMVMEVRDRLIQAYNEVLRMQV